MESKVLVAPKNDANDSFKIQSFYNFVRSNPKTDKFKVKRFHHIEFWCGDATNTSLLFSLGLGMPMLAKSDQSTGNLVHASYVLRSGDLHFLFTAPYSSSSSLSTPSIPTFDYEAHASFLSSHGLGVRAVAIEVEDAKSAFAASVATGARPSAPPVLLEDEQTMFAEVHLFGDVVLRLVSHAQSGATNDQTCYFLPKFSPTLDDGSVAEFGIQRLDHAAGSVAELKTVVEYAMKITGFHEFVPFAAEDLHGKTETGLQSVFLANNDESVFFNFSEPVYGTTMKSPIETFLERNSGPGVHHLAVLTDDIFKTIREMKKRSLFDFMPPPKEDYYKNLRKWTKHILSEKEIQECESLGLKVDNDHEGVIIQTFTKPIGDRLSIFIEVIQRIGCMVQGEDGKLHQKGGCGGFGNGNNFSEVIKSLEKYEKTLHLKV
ncbi:4-hydroxyphenylpyruvate dioxygenase-like [Amaranthus tricolor]|uniref:4-hydroxyphenylpyruvate dioxygenase-like n=1 Tax=Amaranthus tricolor TaxID=29722 RepID=UPI00258F95B3|nr:4-hydroxyphenylpyruvate dioxygenase-like [Amaranthus tricolor]